MVKELTSGIVQVLSEDGSKKLKIALQVVQLLVALLMSICMTLLVIGWNEWQEKKEVIAANERELSIRAPIIDKLTSFVDRGSRYTKEEADILVDRVQALEFRVGSSFERMGRLESAVEDVRAIKEDVIVLKTLMTRIDEKIGMP